jgi:serine/threonine protein kinase
MSEIFLATQKGLAGFRKIVVLKSILPDIRGEDEFVKMFLEEARTTAAFNHPNIAQVFDLDTDEGTLFLAMEFVQGATLVEMARACRQAKEPIPLGFTLASVRDTALALHYAHTFIDPRGRKQVVIHRDVAEKNIMVSYDGTTKLLDFGIAKALGRRSGSMTSIGMVKGTSGYMSPEQIRGEPLDPRSDIFALGVVLHECLTGMRLFHGKNAEDGMLAALREDVQPPSRLSPDVTPALDAVTLKALARDRDQRYGTALEFARAIEKACPGALWHAEQCGDLVQRFYNERRQQTRDLVENAQGGQELTGELRLDKALLAVNNRPPPITRPPTPPAGLAAVGARRVTALTTPIPPVRPPQLKGPPPGVAPRASGEKPQLSTDPVGMDVRVTRAPVQPPGPPVREVTEMNFDSKPSVLEDFDDDEDSGAKTMPATSLPAEMLAQIRANRARVEALTVPVPVRSPITEAPPPAVRHSNVVLEPVSDRSYSSETNTSTATTGPASPLDPFADILDEAEPGLKTAIGRPFDTHADADEEEVHAEEEDEGEDPGPEPATHTGVAPVTGGGIGKFIGIGVVFAIVALGGTLYALKIPPFNETVLGPQPPTRLPGAPLPPAKAEPKPAPVAPAKAIDPPPKVEPKPVKVEPKPPEPVVKVEPPPPEPRPVVAPPPAPEPIVTVKKAEPKMIRKPLPAPVVKRKPEPKDEAPQLLGSLSLVVDPPVHVFFGGKDLGVTPLKATLPVGKQTLKLVPADGPAKSVSVEVKESGGAARFDLEDL